MLVDFLKLVVDELILLIEFVLWVMSQLVLFVLELLSLTRFLGLNELVYTLQDSIIYLCLCAIVPGLLALAII